MKKQITKVMVGITAAMFFSVVSAPAVFAGNVTHTITIVNNSNTAIKSAGNSFQKANFGSQLSCGTDTCPSENNLTVNNSPIPAGGRGTVTMTGPAGCRVMAFMSYWKPDLSGSHGQIQCSKTWSNVCNSGLANLTCTISQGNVDAVRGNGQAAVTASSVQ